MSGSILGSEAHWFIACIYIVEKLCTFCPDAPHLAAKHIGEPFISSSGSKVDYQVKKCLLNGAELLPLSDHKKGQPGASR